MLCLIPLRHTSVADGDKYGEVEESNYHNVDDDEIKDEWEGKEMVCVNEKECVEETVEENDDDNEEGEKVTNNDKDQKGNDNDDNKDYEDEE